MKFNMVLKTKIAFVARGDTPLCEELNDKFEKLMGTYDDVSGEIEEFDEESGIGVVNFYVSNDIDCEVDLSDCYQSGPYFDKVLGQWYPGEENWDPHIKYDEDVLISEAKTALAEIGAIGEIELDITSIEGWYNSFELNEEMAEYLSFEM